MSNIEQYSGLLASLKISRVVKYLACGGYELPADVVYEGPGYSADEADRTKICAVLGVSRGSELVICHHGFVYYLSVESVKAEFRGAAMMVREAHRRVPDADREAGDEEVIKAFLSLSLNKLWRMNTSRGESAGIVIVCTEADVSMKIIVSVRDFGMFSSFVYTCRPVVVKKVVNVSLSSGLAIE